MCEIFHIWQVITNHIKWYIVLYLALLLKCLNCHKLKGMATCYIRWCVKKDRGKEWKQTPAKTLQFCWTTNSRLVITSLPLPHNKQHFCEDKAREHIWHKRQINRQTGGQTESDPGGRKLLQVSSARVCVCLLTEVFVCRSASALTHCCGWSVWLCQCYYGPVLCVGEQA